MRKTLIRLTLFAAAQLGANAAHADSTALDTAFANNGRSNLTYGDYFKTLVHLPRPTGGSVAVVHFRYTAFPSVCPTDRDCLALYRFTDAGATLGALTVPNTVNFSTVRGAAIDSAGRIVVVGSVQVSGSNHDFRIVRLLPDGTPDGSFAVGGMIDVAFNLGGNNADYANAVAFDTLGRIVVVGQIDRASVGDTDFGIVRLTDNGLLDTSFDTDGKRAVLFDLAATLRLDAATSVVVEGNGRITVGGIAVDGALGVSRIGLARLNVNGSFDTSFCPTTCNYMSTYTAINNGRRVIFYGNDTPAQADSLVAMAVNSAGILLTAGTTPGTGETLGYVQRFDASGNWAAEVATSGGVSGSRVYVGGVHWTRPDLADSNVVLTGVSGPNEEFFFAQRFDSLLNASANWGSIGPGNSVYLWTAGNGFGDVGDNRPAQSSIDPSGRILVGGIYKPAALTDPYSATIARLTYNGAVAGNALFANGFEN